MATEARKMSAQNTQPRTNEDVQVKTVMEVYMKMVMCRKTTTQQMKGGIVVPYSITETVEEENPMTYPVHTTETITSSYLGSHSVQQVLGPGTKEHNIPPFVVPQQLHQTVLPETLRSAPIEVVSTGSALPKLPERTSDTDSSTVTLSAVSHNKKTIETQTESTYDNATQTLSNVMEGLDPCTGLHQTRTHVDSDSDSLVFMDDESCIKSEAMSPVHGERSRGKDFTCGRGIFSEKTNDQKRNFGNDCGASISVHAKAFSHDVNEDEDNYVDMESDVPDISIQGKRFNAKKADNQQSAADFLISMFGKENVSLESMEKTLHMRLDLEDKSISITSFQPNKNKDQDNCFASSRPMSYSQANLDKNIPKIEEKFTECPYCHKNFTLSLIGWDPVNHTKKKKPAPVSEKQDKATPVLEKQDKATPVLEKQDKTTPVLVSANSIMGSSSDAIECKPNISDNVGETVGIELDCFTEAEDGVDEGNTAESCDVANDGDVNVEEPVPQQNFMQQLIELTNAKGKNVELQCKTCLKHYSNANNLKKHIELVHAKKRPFCCEICGKRVHCKYDLMEHMTVHSTERKHLCPLCGDSFKTERYLKGHVKRKHQSAHVFPYHCEICGDNMKSSTSLKKHHTRYHTGERARPYVKKKKFNDLESTDL